MSYNFRRRVLRQEKKQFVKDWIKQNNTTDKSLSKLLNMKDKKFSVNNAYDIILEIQISQLEAMKTDKENNFIEEVN